MAKSIALPFKIIDRAYSTQLKIVDKFARRRFQTSLPEVFTAFQEIDSFYPSKVLYFAKCYDLLKLLERWKPKNIVELGSGRTSLIFASYAKQTGSNYLAFEQDLRWTEFINGLIKKHWGLTPIKHSDVTEMPLGGKFVEPIPKDVDFVYVDAPYVKKENKFSTFTGKPAYFDLTEYIKSGGKPNVIVVDGRTDTVDVLRQTLPKEFCFAGGYDWARERSQYGQGLRFNRHSLFTKDTAV